MKKVWFKGVGIGVFVVYDFVKKKIFLKNRLKWNFIIVIYVYLSGNDNGDLCLIEWWSVNFVFIVKNGYIIYLFLC